MHLVFTSLLVLLGFAAGLVTAGCPPDGVWTEWTPTEPCPTTCGAYTNVTRTRTCTNRCGECPCVGTDTDVGPCGIKICPFLGFVPTKTCMDPYRKRLNHDSKEFFCGPADVPKVECTP